MQLLTGFNPAEAEEWFRRVGYAQGYAVHGGGFNPAEAEEWFRSWSSIFSSAMAKSFNPAEAEEWFRRKISPTN